MVIRHTLNLDQSDIRLEHIRGRHPLYWLLSTHWVIVSCTADEAIPFKGSMSGARCLPHGEAFPYDNYLPYPKENSCDSLFSRRSPKARPEGYHVSLHLGGAISE